ncbi:restriction endonuclease subunit S [Thalassolituus marinus]|uniref:Restriction endonuclease subunit S n=1 Tax=Thalassolituus marinus TaxID=671053 RepID=A0ABS7ZMC1_9GAMM|nr:restriction endonuclease subunit S [Thalassolituus marinus]MCA6062864.1 restriction endonuclease subunit S [Thalassolituus marinus]
MGSESTIFTVEELVKAGILERPMDGNHGGIHPKSSDYVPVGIPFVMASDLVNGEVDTRGCKFISAEQAACLKKGFSKTGDVLLSHKATIGRTAIVGEIESEFIMLTPQVTYYRIKDPERLNNKYLRYYFDSLEFQNLFNQWAGGGSTRAYLGITGQLKFPVALPDMRTQLFIADVLGTLDNKIALNRQINTTLESMAQALFKSWFVDFDPVIDNALAAGNEIPDALQKRAAARAARREALRQQTSKTTGATDAASSEQALPETGLSDQRLPSEIQQRFPDRFVFTEEMGWVPEGWGVKPLSSIIELIGGGTPKTSVEEYWGGDIPWFSVVDAPNPSDVFVLYTEKSITQSGLDNSSAKLLRKGTTIISARGTVGKCAVVSRPMAMNQSCYGLVGANGNADFFTYYMVLRKVHELQQRSHGSVFSTITRDTFKGLNVADCSALLTQKFDAQIESYMGRILCNLEQIQVLTNLRDSLLPKLLSGQITIPDAEQQLAEVL